MKDWREKDTGYIAKSDFRDINLVIKLIEKKIIKDSKFYLGQLIFTGRIYRLEDWYVSLLAFPAYLVYLK